MTEAATAPGLRLQALRWGAGDWRSEPADFDLPAGHVLALLGRNGAGKTALLDTLAGLRAPLAGRIFAHGADLTALPPEHRHIGYAMQRDALFPHRTVADNLRFGRGARAALDPLIDAFALRPLLSRKPAQLSGGQRQRVALARALVGPPRLLLLDEPMSAIDPESRPALRETLAALLRDYRLTTVLVSHDPAEALQLADHYARLDDGRLLRIEAAQLRALLPAHDAAPGTADLNRWDMQIVAVEPQACGQRLLLRPVGADGPLLPCPADLPPHDAQPGQAVHLFIDPAQIEVIPSSDIHPPRADEWALPATLCSEQREGPLHRLELRLPWGASVHALLLPPARRRLQARLGQTVWLRVDPRCVRALSAHPGRDRPV